MDILRDLFDEKILEIINLLVENPEKKYSLTDISTITKVNVATTFRIINKLSKKDFIETFTIGKVKVYQLAKNNKTEALSKLLKKDTGPLQKFIENLYEYINIKKVILESSENNTAKILIIGEDLPSEKISRIVENIKNKFSFNIEFVEITESQFEGLKKFKNYDLEKKIIWQRSL